MENKESQLAIMSGVFNNYEVLEDLFNSLEKQTDKAFHLFLSDSSVNKQELPAFSWLTLKKIEKNLGYAGLINAGLKTALTQGYTRFTVINSDVVLSDNFVERVSLSLTQYPQSIIGGKIYYAKNFEYHRQRYSESEKGRVIWYAGGLVDWKNALTKHLGVDEVDKGQYNQLTMTEFITGCLMCFDKQVVDKIGFWDESYFLYYEDADYCERAKKTAVPLIYDPNIVLWHKNAQSTGGAGSLFHQKYQNRNRLKFGLKYAPFRTKLHLIKNYFLEKSGFLK